MHLPGPFRAAVGLVASAADEVRHLPDRALELPMLAVSTALQASVRAQQRYARLTARGDDVLNWRRPSDEPPQWATFDDPVDDLRPPVVPDDAGADLEVAAELIENPGATRDTLANGKAVRKPRHTAPSRFDDASDE